MAFLKITLSDGREHKVPARYEICPCCDGRAVTSRAVECDGGGFTASEWAEQDDDFKEDYLAGAYDRPCQECCGTPGRVLVIDREATPRHLIAAYDAACEAEAYIRAERDAERRAGC